MNNKIKKTMPILAIFAFLFGISQHTVQAQDYMLNGRFYTDGKQFTIPGGNREVIDIVVPGAAYGKYLRLSLTGADGGRVRAGIASLWKAPGQGATVDLEVKIGDAPNEIKMGSTIRFIIGQRGADRTVSTSPDYKAGGGGGGTGVAFKNSGSSNWTLLAVAGGGTGSSTNAWGDGKNGNEGKGIEYIMAKSSTGEGGKGRGTACDRVASGGGGAFADGIDKTVKEDGNSRTCTIKSGKAGWPNGPDSGEPTGGSGQEGGGWGFGGGGGSPDQIGNKIRGGGGGYTGGYADNGGTSFLNIVYAKGTSKTNGANTSSDHGKVVYRFSTESSYNLAQVKLSHATQNCIRGNVIDTLAVNGRNIDVWECSGNQYKLNWDMSDDAIRFGALQNLCLDVENANTSNGTNVRLWECIEHDGQRWIYDGVSKQLRSFLNLNKCMDASLTRGSNVKLWDCSTTTHQNWDIDGATTVSNPTAVKNIVPVKSNYSNTRALQSADGAKAGSNIQLGEKSSTDGSIRFVFDGLQIKYGPSRDLCLTLHEAGTSNGTNIELRGCSDIAAKQWIYDGNTKQIRSVADPDKCIEVETNGLYKVGSNLKLMDCGDQLRQQFEIVDK